MEHPEKISLTYFSRRVRERRKALLIDMKVIAKRIGIATKDYEDIECGRTFPDRKLLSRLSLELRASEQFLVRGNA